MERDHKETRNLYGEDLAGLTMRLQKCLGEARVVAEQIKRQIESGTQEKEALNREEVEELCQIVRKSLQKTNMFMFANGVTNWSRL